MPSLLSLQLLTGCVAISAVSYRAKVDRVTEAIDKARVRTGIGDTTAAYLMEMDPSQWTKCRAMGGVLGRLIALPAEFWREFLPALGQIVNVPVHAGGDDERLESVVRRALKAELRCHDASESDTSSAA